MTKTLILNYSKWRCGGDSINKIGRGDTYLRNSSGFECCLGQFAKQLGDIKNKDILCVGYPDGLDIKIPLLNIKEKIGESEGCCFTNTPLADKAAKINDSDNTTPAEKITALRKLFAKKGYKILLFLGWAVMKNTEPLQDSINDIKNRMR